MNGVPTVPTLSSVPNTTYQFSVPADVVGMRIDKYITQIMPHYSRTFVQMLIQKGCITINGTAIGKTSIQTKASDTVSVHVPEIRSVDPEALKQAAGGIEILLEHEHFLVLNKPAGLLVHPPTKTSSAPTLVDWLVAHSKAATANSPERSGIVHRLDRDTSGVIIIARTPYAHMVFSKLFKDRAITKKYLAIVHGSTPDTFAIDSFIGRDPITKIRMATLENTAHTKRTAAQAKFRSALTHVTTLERYNGYSLVEAQPVTGRTHQIRIHLQSAGYPIVGDLVYHASSEHITRQALHAHSIAFTFDEKEYCVQAPLPDDMKQLVVFIK